MKKYVLILVTFMFFISSGPIHASTVLFQHTGANDPTSEGWTHNVGTGGTSTGAVINDLGSGIDAWYIEDTSVAGGSWESYTQVPDSAELAAASVYGWTLSTTLRMVNDT